MCDHAFSPQLLQALLDSAASDPLGDTCRVAADRSSRTDAYADEATKLATDDAGFVTAIGKSVADWDALDAGAFVCSPAIWNAVEAAPDDCGLSDIFAVLVRDGRLGTVDVSGHFWYDIDTAADLREAERLFAAATTGAASRR